jgi:exosortase D (VPLPA-CTERM-specific)
MIAFALLMALTMFPPPHFLNTKLTFGLKLISSQLGVALLHLYGMSAYREGNVIDLGFTQLQVVDACSGLRFLFPLLIMGILLAYYYRAALWKRLVLVLSTIPLTIVTNSLRIALTGIIYTHWGAAAAEGFFHGFSGWLIFMVSLAVLLAEIWVLRRIATGPGESFFPKSGAKHQTPETIEAHPTNKGWRGFFAPPQFVVGVVVLLLTMGISAGVEFREKVPSSRLFSQFPLTAGPWGGTRQYLEQKFLAELDLSDYVMIDYLSPQGKPVNFYVAYYESQRKGESIHSPETCMPGGGWIFNKAGTVQVALAEPGRSITVNRAVVEKSGNQQLAYFWFPARGRILTNALEMKIYTFWDALTRQRTDGALVRLITPMLPGEQAEDAEKRLQEFTKQIVPVLNEFIPQ